MSGVSALRLPSGLLYRCLLRHSPGYCPRWRAAGLTTPCRTENWRQMHSLRWQHVHPQIPFYVTCKHFKQHMAKYSSDTESRYSIKNHSYKQYVLSLVQDYEKKGHSKNHLQSIAELYHQLQDEYANLQELTELCEGKREMRSLVVILYTQSGFACLGRNLNSNGWTDLNIS